MGFFSRFTSKEDKAPKRSTARNTRGGSRLDPDDDHKRKARRRLVGSIALLLTAIIILPMVLDDEPKPVSDNMALMIPSRDTPFTSQAKNLAKSDQEASLKEAPLKQTTQRDSPMPPATVKAPESAAEPAPALPDVTGGAAGTAKVAPAPKPEPKSEPKPASKAELKAEPKAESKPEPKVEHKAEQKPDPKPDPIAQFAGKPPSAASSAPVTTRHYVQVGAFSSEAKAKEVTAQLKAKGFAASIEASAGQNSTVYRVRTGPYSEREAAVKARDQLASGGITGVIVQ